MKAKDIIVGEEYAVYGRRQGGIDYALRLRVLEKCAERHYWVPGGFMGHNSTRKDGCRVEILDPDTGELSPDAAKNHRYMFDKNGIVAHCHIQKLWAEFAEIRVKRRELAEAAAEKKASQKALASESCAFLSGLGVESTVKTYGGVRLEISGEDISRLVEILNCVDLVKLKGR